MQKHNKIIIIAGVGLGIAIAGIVVAFFIAKMQPELTAEEHYARGESFLKKKSYLRALRHFLKAAEKKPQEASYHWKVVEWAINLGKVDYAPTHAELAWNTGMKTEEVLLTRVNLTELDDAGKLSFGLELLPEIAEPEAREALRGDLYFQFGQAEDGLTIYKNLFEQKRSAELVSKITLAYMQLDKAEDAFQFINKLRNTDLLNTAGYHLLVTLFAYRQELAEIDSAFREAKERNQFDGALQLRHAIFKAVINEMNKGIDLLTMLLEKPDLNSESSGESEVQHHASEALRHRARLYLAFFYAVAKDMNGIHQLIGTIGEDKTRIQEGEKYFYDYLLLPEEKKDEIPNELVKAKKLLPPHAIIELFIMNEKNRLGHHTDALVAHNRLLTADRLTAFIPSVVLEYSIALAGAERIDEAIYLLNELHSKRNIHSKRSVSLLRTYMQQANMPDESWKLQEFLFDKYGDDIDVQFSGGQLALSFGKWDKAFEIFQDLAGRYPEEVRFKVAGIEVLLRKGDYEGVLVACRNSTVPKVLLAPLEALAYKELGQLKKAETAFETAMTGATSKNIQIEYAYLLYQLDKLDRARELLEDVMKQDSQNTRARLGMAFIAFRDGDLVEAKTILTPLISENDDMLLARLKMTEIDLAENNWELALSSCRNIRQRHPDEPHAAFMEGICLRRLNRPAEAEKVLEQCLRNSKDSVQVTIQLALAKKSLKKYDEAIALIDEQLAENAEDKNLRLIRFSLLCFLEQFVEAEQLLKQLKPLLPGAEFTRHAAWLLEQQGRSTEAIKTLASNLDIPSLALYWAKLKIIAGEATSILSGLKDYTFDREFWTELGHYCVARNSPEIAVGAYQKAIESGSTDPSVLNNFAWYAMQDDPYDKDEILSAIRKAHELQPVHVEILDTYATALIRFERYDECISVLEDKRKIIEYNAGLLMHLAKAYEETGNVIKAIENYSQVLEIRWNEGADIDSNALKNHVEELRKQL